MKLNRINSFRDKDIYMSVVFNNRNDGYPEGRGVKLLEISTNDMISKLSSLDFFSEILIVDYNPPEDKDKLKEILKLNLSQNVIVRFIEVEKKYHLPQKYSNKFPLNPEFAQNIGIQRAKGKFILSKSSDTIINDEFFNFVGKKRLNQIFFYRCPRVDLNSEDFMNKKFPSPEKTKNTNSKILINSGGDFVLMSSLNWKKVAGYWENGESYQDGSDTILLHSAFQLGIKEFLIKNCYVFKPIHNLMYHTRTTYRPKKTDIAQLDWLYYFFKRALEKLGFTSKKALISSKDGSGEKIEVQIYCFDLIQKIKKRKIKLPLNHDPNWGLKKENLNVVTLK